MVSVAKAGRFSILGVERLSSGEGQVFVQLVLERPAEAVRSTELCRGAKLGLVRQLVVDTRSERDRVAHVLFTLASVVNDSLVRVSEVVFLVWVASKHQQLASDVGAHPRERTYLTCVDKLRPKLRQTLFLVKNGRESHVEVICDLQVHLWLEYPLLVLICFRFELN